MTPFGRIINTYYDFSEKCGDDIDIMTRCIKMCGCKKRPNVIKTQLELIDFDKPYAEALVEFMGKASDDTINRAKWSVQKERGHIQLTLPTL